MHGASVFSPRPRARRPRATSPRAIVHDLIRCHRVASRTMTPRSASQKGGARVVAVRLVVGSRSRSSVRGDRPIDRMSDHIIHHSVLPHTASQKSARVGDNAHDGKSIVHVYFPPYEKEAITRRRRRPAHAVTVGSRFRGGRCERAPHFADATRRVNRHGWCVKRAR